MHRRARGRLSPVRSLETEKIWIEEVAFSTRSMLYNRLQRLVHKTSVVVTWYVIFRATVYTVTARIKFAKVHI